MKKILFPTEFSDHAPIVFRYAAELAYFFNARLVVMNAFGKPNAEVLDKNALEHGVDVATDNMISFVQEHLPEQYREKIGVDYIAKIGFPTKAILEVVMDEKIDLVVMGMVGKTNALSTIFGSTTLDILAQADCPVLMIPTSTEFAGIDNLAYTTNFEFRDLGAINYLKKWAKTFNAPIHCLHIHEADDNQEEDIKNMSILKDTYGSQKKILFDMIAGKFEDTIESFARSKKADVIVMMAHKRSFIPRLLQRSAVNGIARRIHLPLLVIKENAYEIEDNSANWLNIVHSIA